MEDTIHGECGRRGRTLEQHCKPEQCHLYHTKPGTIPAQFVGFTQAVFVCRARQLSGLDLTDYPMPYWAEKAYILGNGVYRQLENSPPDDDKAGTSWAITGDGDTGAFKLINEHIREMSLKRKR